MSGSELIRVKRQKTKHKQTKEKEKKKPSMPYSCCEQENSVSGIPPGVCHDHSGVSQSAKEE